MDELLKMLNIKEINFIYIDYTDNHGNFKELKLENRKEKLDRGD